LRSFITIPYLPYNSAARQLVYTESGRAVESVIVDGRASRKRALPHMLEAHRKVWQADVGMNRFIPRTR
jgi:hypothetical protein